MTSNYFFDSTTIYYLFSSLPQVIGAVFAISTGFILRKFDRWEKELQDCKKLEWHTTCKNSPSVTGLIEILSTSSINFGHCLLNENGYLLREPNLSALQIIHEEHSNLINSRIILIKHLFNGTALFFCIAMICNFTTLILAKPLAELKDIYLAIIISLNIFVLLVYSRFQWVLISNTFIEPRDTLIELKKSGKWEFFKRIIFPSSSNRPLGGAAAK